MLVYIKRHTVCPGRLVDLLFAGCFVAWHPLIQNGLAGCFMTEAVYCERTLLDVSQLSLPDHPSCIHGSCQPLWQVDARIESGGLKPEPGQSVILLFGPPVAASCVAFI